MSRFKKMPESTSYRVISHSACDKWTVCFSPCTWYSDSESSPNRSLLFARDGQPLNSPISSLGLKARQSWQLLSLSLEKKTPPFWGYSSSFMLRQQSRLYTQMKVAMWKIPSRRVVGKSPFNSVWSGGITLKELCQLSFSSTWFSGI